VVHDSAGRLFRRPIAGQVRSWGSHACEPSLPQRSKWRKSSANAHPKNSVEEMAVRFRCKLFYLKRAFFTTFLIFYKKFVQFVMAQKTAVKIN
jgi:hypothetical protein